MTIEERRVAVLGAGTIGEALIAGLLSGGWREPGEIVATGRRDERIAELREKLGVEATLSNADAVAGAALVVIAVKPQDFDDLLGEIATVVTAEQTVLSIEAGILLGLGRDVSTQLVVQTMLGTAKLLRDEHMHPVELRERVTSPGGTTIRAVRELEQAGVRAAFLNAIQAAMDRSRELAAGAP